MVLWSRKIIINSAQISEDSDKEGNPVEDKDSTPDKWVEGEDDQDKEYIKLRYFDLALRKWVTEEDKKIEEKNREKEKEAFAICQEKI